MKQIIIRMLVGITMCAVTKIIGFASLMVISSTPQVHTESIWILRLFLASILSPILYSFLYKLTAGWTIRAKHNSCLTSNQSLLSIKPSAVDKPSESHFSNPEFSRFR
jgi:hypothetical protein